MVSDSLREEIRSMVRGALRDILPRLEDSSTSVSSDPAAKDMADRISAAARGDGGPILVRIASDEDLRAFAALFITCPDPIAQAAVLQGKVKLVLDRGGGAMRGGPAGGPRPETDRFDMESGVLNERRVSEIARNHKVVALAPEVVITPLAYDRARSCGLQIVRKKG